MKKLMMMAAATVAAWSSWGAESISVDKVANHYPWDGKVDCVCTLGGAENGFEYKGVFTLSVERGGEVVRKVVTNDLTAADGTYTNTFDCAELFGAGYYPNGGISVALVKVKKLGGVQLWADGPYWAECNVGASKPEQYGYYFWWGDTVGYTPNEAYYDEWVSVKDGTSFTFTSENCPTWHKEISELQSAGYIDATGNLVEAHDAATEHLGAPWRMPTDAEMQALISNCTSTWITTNGVKGLLVTGKGAYGSKSIFLPAAGVGVDDWPCLVLDGSWGRYWSSSAFAGHPDCSWTLLPGLGNDGTVYFTRNYYDRWLGQSVRPVRGSAK